MNLPFSRKDSAKVRAKKSKTAEKVQKKSNAKKTGRRVDNPDRF